MKQKLALALLLAVSLQNGAAQTVNGSQLDNVSLTLSLNSSPAYIDGEQVSSSTTVTDFENGYISGTEPTALAGASNPVELSFRDEADSNLLLGGYTDQEFTVVQREGSFLVPHTSGGFQAARNRFDLVGEDFLNSVAPSFGFPLERTRYVKLVYSFPYNVTNFSRVGNVEEMYIRNTVSSKSYPELRIEAE